MKRAESDEAPGQPSAESGGPLLQQYNAAVGFLQSMFSKTTEVSSALNSQLEHAAC